MKFDRWILCTTAMICVPVGNMAYAQQAANAASTAEPLQDRSADTATASGEIVVTAQRRAEALSRTPVAVSVVSAATLAKQGVSTEADLQAIVPGLFVKASQSSNQLNYALRGQSLEPFGSVVPGVLPYVNEVQIGGEGSSPFYDLQSIQVLKGPQGTLFGRNAVGGAVLFTTAKPTDTFGGYLSGRIGTYKLRQIEGAINIPLSGDKLMLRVAGAHERRNGFQHNRYDDSRIGDVSRDSVRGSLTIAPSDGFKNETVLSYNRSGGSSMSAVLYSVVPQGQAAPTAVPANIFFSPQIDSIFGAGAWAAYLAAHPKADPDGLVASLIKQKERGPYDINVDTSGKHRARQVSLSNISTIDLGANTQLKNVFGYSKLHSFDIGEFDGSSYGIDSLGPIGRDIHLRQISEELQLLGKAAGERLTYVVGLYYAHERNDTDSQSLAFDLSPNGAEAEIRDTAVTTSEIAAAYAQGTFNLSDVTGIQGLSITAGARYTSEKISHVRGATDLYVVSPQPGFDFSLKDTFKKVSWQIGLQEQVNNQLMLYAVSRRSFRSGGFNLFGPPIPGFGETGGAEFRPQTATDVEIGVKYSGSLAGAPFRLNLAAYNLWLKNNQNVTYVQIGGAASAVTVNVPKAKVSGFELDAVITPADWLTIGGAINYTDARYTSNAVSILGQTPVAFGPYPDSPEWSGAVFAEVRAPLTEGVIGSLRGDLSGQSKTPFSSTQSTFNPGAVLPGYMLANFRVSVETKDTGWTLSAILKNAFNKVYYVGGLGLESVFTQSSAVPGERRTFLVQLRKSF